MSELRVRLYVYEPSDVELDAREKVQLRRLAYSAVHGFTAERHGGLLPPGTSRLRLDPGVYHFRALDDAALRVASGGAVTVVDDSQASVKDPPPPPPFTGGPAAPEHVDAFVVRGRGPRRIVPRLTVDGATLLRG